MTSRWPSSVSAAETPAESRSGQSPPPRLERHFFIQSANPRHPHCERCGLPRKAHEDPVTHRTSVVGHLNLALKAAKEQDMHLCAVHVGTAQKLLEGDD